jgi:hypothetical protein
MPKKLLIYSLVVSLLLAIWHNGCSALGSSNGLSKISRVKADERSLATAAESVHFESHKLLAQAQRSPFPAAADTREQSTAEDIGPKIIRTGHIHLTSKDTESAKTALEELFPDFGAHIAHMHGGGDPGTKSYDLTIRIHADRFDDMRTAIKRLAVRILSEQINATDVTDQFVDFEARRRALEATESELLEILRESREQGRKVQDVMSVFTELTNVRSQIESIRGRLNVLSDQVALATLTVRITPDERPAPIAATAGGQGWSAGRIFRESVAELIVISQTLATISIRAAIVHLPIALLFMPLAYGAARLLALARRRLLPPVAGN